MGFWSKFAAIAPFAALAIPGVGPAVAGALGFGGAAAGAGAGVAAGAGIGLKDLLMAGIPAGANLAGAGIASRGNNAAARTSAQAADRASLLQNEQFKKAIELQERNHADMTRDFAPFLKVSQETLPRLSQFAQAPPQVTRGQYGNTVAPAAALTGGPSLTSLLPQGGTPVNSAGAQPVSTAQPVGGPAVKLTAPDGSETRQFAANDPMVQSHLKNGWRRG